MMFFCVLTPRRLKELPARQRGLSSWPAKNGLIKGELATLITFLAGY
jgi:hypothetical protein